MDNHSIALVDHCRIIDLPRIRHNGGTITFAQNDPNALFDIKRVYYLYDIPGDSERGGHSHRDIQVIIMAVSGCFDVTVNDGHNTRTFTLNRPYRGLYIPGGIWRHLDNFSSGSVCLVLASEKYDEADYVRDYDQFLELSKNKVSL